MTQPTGSHGVLLDAVTSTNGIENIGPIATLVADSNPPLGKLFYTINNQDAISKNITLLLYYYALEIEPRVPFGHLRKHYRFFRDNSTATKRRNYVGCLNTKDTTIDGKDPVEIFVSEGTEITVARTITNTEITTGGGGTLNVT